MKHKRPKVIELRSTEKDKVRRHGQWRMAILVVCTVLVTAALITALIRIGTDVPADPNAAAKHAPAKTK
jgi:hypothetical protein